MQTATGIGFNRNPLVPEAMTQPHRKGRRFSAPLIPEDIARPTGVFAARLSETGGVMPANHSLTLIVLQSRKLIVRSEQRRIKFTRIFSTNRENESPRPESFRRREVILLGCPTTFSLPHH
jgi:hypothetical protein